MNDDSMIKITKLDSPAKREVGLNPDREHIFFIRFSHKKKKEITTTFKKKKWSIYFNVCIH